MEDCQETSVWDYSLGTDVKDLERDVRMCRLYSEGNRDQWGSRSPREALGLKSFSKQRCWHGEILPRPLQESVWEGWGPHWGEVGERNRARDRRNRSMLTDAFLWPGGPWLRSPQLKKPTWKIFSSHLGLLQHITNSSSDVGNWGWLAAPGNFPFVPPAAYKYGQSSWGWAKQNGGSTSPTKKDKDWKKIWWSCFERKKNYMECHISQTLDNGHLQNICIFQK